MTSVETTTPEPSPTVTPVVEADGTLRHVPHPPRHVQTQTAAARRAGRVDHDQPGPGLRPRRRVRIRQIDHRPGPAAPRCPSTAARSRSPAATSPTLNTRELRPLRREMQMVFQDPYSSLDPSAVIADIVGEPLRVHEGIKGKARDDRVRELLSPSRAVTEVHRALPLRVLRRATPTHRHRPRHRPQPEAHRPRRSRLGPRRLHPEPDPRAPGEQLRDDLGVAYLFISHNLSVIRWLADRTAVMYLGRIVEEGPTERVYTHPAHPYTESLLSAVPVPDPAIQRARRPHHPPRRHPRPPAPTVRVHRSAPAATTPWTSAPTITPMHTPLPDGGWVACHLHTTNPGTRPRPPPDAHLVTTTTTA